jgi:predicted permease
VLVELLSIVAPIYITVGLGYGWARSGRRYDTELITELIMTVGAPCLVFSSLVRLEMAPSALAEMAGATLVALACFAAVAGLILRIARLPLTSFVAPMAFANTGNMGLPVCLFAFGQEGLALGVCVYATCAISQYTLGLWLWSGEVSLRQLARTPLAYGALFSVLAVASGVSVPEWIQQTTTLLGDFTIPLMQFTLGVTLGRLRLGRAPRIFALSGLRIGMGFALGIALSGLLGFEGVTRGVFILQCSMPVAVLNYLLAEKYNRSPADVASLVLLSTLMSLVALPLILAWLLR